MSRAARQWGAAVGTVIVAVTAVLLQSAPAEAVPVPPPPEVTVLPESAPYPVAQVRLTFVDPSRSAPARGAIPGEPRRTIETTVYYPVSIWGPARVASPSLPATSGPFPLVVFAHGYSIEAGAYSSLLTDLAAAGFVVAAPDFPGTSTAYPGPPNRGDLVQQPGDVAFVITSMLERSTAPGSPFGRLDPTAIGVAGQSDGGVTAAAAALNTCCIDTRIGASVVLSGGAFGFDGQWFPSGTAPVLFVHATGDEVNPYAASTSMFTRAQSSKYLLTVSGGSHLGTFVDAPYEPHVATAIVAFLERVLEGDASAGRRLVAEGDQVGYTLQAA